MLRRHKVHPFYETFIEGVRFEAWITIGGPYLHMTGINRPHPYKSGVALGVSTINRFEPSPLIVSPGCISGGGEESGWWIAKYGNEPIVDINCLSDQGRQTLAKRMGILEGSSELNNCEEAFWDSDAFRSLQKWAAAHPRLLKVFELDQFYLPWIDRIASLGTDISLRDLNSTS